LDYALGSFGTYDYFHYIERGLRELENAYPVILRVLFNTRTKRYNALICPRSTANSEHSLTVEDEDPMNILPKVEEHLKEGNYSRFHVIDMELGNTRLYYDEVEKGLCFEESRDDGEGGKVHRHSIDVWEKEDLDRALKAFESGQVDFTEWS
jgi:hypothetical protein